MRTDGHKQGAKLFLLIFSIVVATISPSFALAQRAPDQPVDRLTGTRLAQVSEISQAPNTTSILDDEEAPLKLQTTVVANLVGGRQSLGEIGFCGDGGIVGFINNLINILFGFAGAIAVVMVTIYGFRYIFSGIQGNVSGQSSAKVELQNVFLTLVVLLASYLILSYISPNYLEFCNRGTQTKLIIPGSLNSPDATQPSSQSVEFGDPATAPQPSDTPSTP